jgi:hypothetical protein
MNIDMDTNDDSNGNGNKNDDIDTLNCATTTTRREWSILPNPRRVQTLQFDPGRTGH